MQVQAKEEEEEEAGFLTSWRATPAQSRAPLKLHAVEHDLPARSRVSYFFPYSLVVFLF